MIRVPALAAALLCVTAATHASAAMTATPVLTGLTNLRDTAPDPRGRRLYFIADGSRGPAVFRLTLASGTVRELWSGAPLVSPQGLAVGDDGGEVYVADPGAAGGGVLFAFDDAGPRPLVRGYHPRGVEVRAGHVYFTGDDKRNGLPGLFRVHEDGGRVEILAEGGPFRHPVGVALGRRGDAWISDETGPGWAQVIHVEGGQAEIVTVALPVGRGRTPWALSRSGTEPWPDEPVATSRTRAGTFSAVPMLTTTTPRRR